MQKYKKNPIPQNLLGMFKKKVVFLHPENECETMEGKVQKNDNLQALLDRARRYCAGAEQCEDSVRQKLVNWGATPAESDVVVARLYDEMYLDDNRFARAYCESKILRQHWGRQKVLYQLRLKHLSRAAVDNGMAAISDEAYFAVLSELAERKGRELQQRVADEYVLRQKLTAFLVSRGFLLSEINQVITNNLNL